MYIYIHTHTHTPLPYKSVIAFPHLLSESQSPWNVPSAECFICLENSSFTFHWSILSLMEALLTLPCPPLSLRTTLSFALTHWGPVHCFGDTALHTPLSLTALWAWQGQDHLMRFSIPAPWHRDCHIIGTQLTTVE